LSLHDALPIWSFTPWLSVDFLIRTVRCPMQRTIFVCIRNTAASFALIFCVLVAASSGQANVQGRWSTLTTPMPINPVHVILLYNGKVLIVSGSGNVAANTNYQAAIWDPQ